MFSEVTEEFNDCIKFCWASPSFPELFSSTPFSEAVRRLHQQLTAALLRMGDLIMLGDGGLYSTTAVPSPAPTKDEWRYFYGFSFTIIPTEQLSTIHELTVLCTPLLRQFRWLKLPLDKQSALTISSNRLLLLDEIYAAMAKECGTSPCSFGTPLDAIVLPTLTHVHVSAIALRFPALTSDSVYPLPEDRAIAARQEHLDTAASLGYHNLEVFSQSEDAWCLVSFEGSNGATETHRLLRATNPLSSLEKSTLPSLRRAFPFLVPSSRLTETTMRVCHGLSRIAPRHRSTIVRVVTEHVEQALREAEKETQKIISETVKPAEGPKVPVMLSTVIEDLPETTLCEKKTIQDMQPQKAKGRGRPKTSKSADKSAESKQAEKDESLKVTDATSEPEKKKKRKLK